MHRNVLLVIIGIVIGVILYHIFFRPEIKIITETVTKTDTVYIVHRDTVRLTRTQIKHEYLRDTVLINFEPKINRFKATFPIANGNAYVSGEVLGEVLKMDLNTDLKLPIVTNTITNTRTIMEKKKAYS